MLVGSGNFPPHTHGTLMVTLPNPVKTIMPRKVVRVEYSATTHHDGDWRSTVPVGVTMMCGTHTVEYGVELDLEN